MKKIIGTVVSYSASNVKVQYSISWVDKKYKKALSKQVIIKAHSDFELNKGDQVVLRSCAPISKTKKYIVVKEEAL